MIFYGKTFQEKQIERKGRDYDDDVRKLKGEIERWRREASAVVDTYYVASGKLVIDGQDGYDPIRALRIHLERG